MTWPSGCSAPVRLTFVPLAELPKLLVRNGKLVTVPQCLGRVVLARHDQHKGLDVSRWAFISSLRSSRLTTVLILNKIL